MPHDYFLLKSHSPFFRSPKPPRLLYMLPSYQLCLLFYYILPGMMFMLICSNVFRIKNAEKFMKNFSALQVGFLEIVRYFFLSA